VFSETPIGPNASLIEVSQPTGGHVAQNALLLMCDFARLTLDRGSRYFAARPWVRGEGGKSTCRMNFFAAPPDTVPLINMLAEHNEGVDPETAAYDAVQVLEFCKLMGVGVRGAPRSPAGAEDVGYRAEGDLVVFEFDPRRYESVTHNMTGEWLKISDIAVRSVVVAGDFNGWSRDAWPMQDTGKGVYELVRSADDFAGRPEWLFKFVVNAVYWVEPPDQAPNRVPVGPDSPNQNLVLRMR
jgi:hypothetical protein